MARKGKRSGGLQMMPEFEEITDVNGVTRRKRCKRRNVGCIIWCEDLERLGLTYYDLLQHLDGLCVKAVCSPVHDRDKYTAEDVRNWCERHIDPDTGDVASIYTNRIPRVGDPKKPHIHVGFNLTKQVTREQASEELLGALLDYPVTKWAIIPDMDSYACYMCHKHNPDKAYYPPNSVQSFGGFDISAVLAEDKARGLYNLAEVLQYAHENKLRYIHQLWNWANSTGDYAAIDTVYGRAGFINMILQSERQQRVDEASERKNEEAKAAMS